MSRRTIAVILLVAAAAATQAQDAPKSLVPAVAPAGTQTARVDLGAEFPQMKGYVVTQTYTVVQPNTGRPWHSHAQFPEIVRILSGTLTEAHDGEPPHEYGPGSTMVNAGGRQHMWANLGQVPVVFISTAIRSAQ